MVARTEVAVTEGRHKADLIAGTEETVTEDEKKAFVALLAEETITEGSWMAGDLARAPSRKTSQSLGQSLYQTISWPVGQR